MSQKQGCSVSIWYCPMWVCPFTAGETEEIILHLEKHNKSDEIVHRELERFERAVFDGGIACGKTPDDPERPEK